MKYRMTTAAKHCFILTAVLFHPTFAQELERDSPLQKYPGFSYNEEYEKLQIDQERARTQIISTCMENAGFNYIEGEYFEIEVGSDEIFTAADAETAVEQLRLKDELYEEQLPEDVAGYYRALYGEVDMDNPGPEFLETIQSGGAGCFGRAEREIVSIFAVSSSLAKDYADAMYSVYKNSQYLDAQAKWMTCITTTGYSFENPIALRTAVVSGVGMDTTRSLSESEKASILEKSKECISEANLDRAVIEAKAKAEKNFYLKHRRDLEMSIDRVPALRKKVNQILK